MFKISPELPDPGPGDGGVVDDHQGGDHTQQHIHTSTDQVAAHSWDYNIPGHNLYYIFENKVIIPYCLSFLKTFLYVEKRISNLSGRQDTRLENF